MKLAYYPGCALHGSSNDYEQSLRACLGKLEVEPQEIKEWICCGATAAHALNHKLSIALPARNLALAEQQGFEDMLAPCPMCSMQLLKAAKLMDEDAGLRREISSVIEVEASGRLQVLNLIQVFQRIGLDRIKPAVKKPLADLKPACYYGCLLTRPPDVVKFDDPEQPSSMEAIMAMLGAKPVDWNYRTECCGAGMTMAKEATVLELSQRILADAREHGANCLVTACPMCHVNLDMKQGDIEQRYGTRFGLPIYYLTDVVGLALGLSSEELGIDRHFVKQPQ
ncbi:MAG: CoB--CoM heterodisulfide reductase iron-sulfur subunit B family protein [Terriglobia bacterium]|jgi:heterodisulfide reductase subunit B